MPPTLGQFNQLIYQDNILRGGGPSIANRKASRRLLQTRSSVPSVASESHTLPPSRSHLPSHRAPSDADARQPAPPFADLLDSAPPVAEPPPAPTRQPRSGRADQPKRTDDR